MAQGQLPGEKADTNAPQDIAEIWTGGFKQLLDAQEELVEKLKQDNDWWTARW